MVEKPEKIIAFFLISMIILGLMGLILFLFSRAYDLSVLKFEDFSPPIFLIAMIFIPIFCALILFFIGRQIRRYLKKESQKKIAKAVGLLWAIIFGGLGVTTLYIIMPSVPYLSKNLGPYLTWSNLQDPSNSITVCWVSNVPMKSEMDYGFSLNNLEFSAESTEMGQFHHIQLKNLLPNTTYYYQIPGFNKNSIKMFKTATLGPHNFTFCLWSDPRTNEWYPSAYNGVVLPEIMAKHLAADKTTLAFSIETGDITSAYFDKQTWNMWFDDITKEDFAANASHVVAIGNHERTLDTRAQTFRQYYPYENLTYSFNYGNLHVICLDTWVESQAWFGNISEALYTWIEADLQANSHMNFTIINLHPAPIHWGNLEGDWFSGHTFNALSTLAQKYGIDAIFFGHHHHYETSYINGTYYMNIGFGESTAQDQYHEPTKNYTLDAGRGLAGYCRVDVTPNTMHLRPIWINGTAMRSYVINA